MPKKKKTNKKKAMGGKGMSMQECMKRMVKAGMSKDMAHKKCEMM